MPSGSPGEGTRPGSAARPGDPGEPALLADPALPLPIRLQLYDALLVLSHLDDYFENRLGIGAAFASQAWLDPYARLLEPPGTNEAALADYLKPGSGERTVHLHHNDWESSLYLFAGLVPVAEQQALVAGPIGTGVRKVEDFPLPRGELIGPYRTVEVVTLCEDVDRLRFFRLDFSDLAPPTDAERVTHTLIVRAMHRGPSDGSRMLGVRASADVLPPGRYEIHIRAFRLTGVEEGGCHLKELSARSKN